MLVSQLSGHCNGSNLLWRHKHNVKQASDTRGWFVKIAILTVTYGFVMSCKKCNYVLLSWQTISVLFWCIFPRCCANREINTKITLEWALEYIISFFIYSRQTRGVGRGVCGLCTCVCVCVGGGGGGGGGGHQSVFLFCFVCFLVESCFHIHNALYFPLKACLRLPYGIGVMVYKRHTQTIGWVYEYHNMTESIVNHTHPGGDLELVDGTNTNHSMPTLLLGGSGDASDSKYGLVWLGLKISIKIYNFDDMTCGYTKDWNEKHHLYIFVNTL